jgi:putative restriction endonuclease
LTNINLDKKDKILILKCKNMLFADKIKQLREKEQRVQYPFAAALGLRISAVANVSMVDACHIVPFSDAYDDTLTNGIALCPNLHRSFDRGLISISDNYAILVNENFIENQKSVFNISQFAGKQIFLPYAEELYPDLGNIAVHRKKFNF